MVGADVATVSPSRSTPGGGTGGAAVLEPHAEQKAAASVTSAPQVGQVRAAKALSGEPAGRGGTRVPGVH